MSPLWQVFAFLAVAPAYISAVSFDCNGEIADEHKLVVSALGGPKTVHYQEDTGVSIRNTTFTIDICNPIKLTNEVPSQEQCEQGTRVCGVTRLWHDNTSQLEEVIEIAGEYAASNGRALAPDVKWIPYGEAHGDAEKEGFRVTFNGGKSRKSDGKKQRAIIEFLCNHDLVGDEDPGREESSSLRRRDDEGEDEKPSLPDPDKGKSLQFVSYDKSDKSDGVDTLRLKWETQFACADAQSIPPSSRSSHWGFFTWFIIITFLLAASYIIFGSWLNYNRYGARGWDLIPHGDTIRDLPYIVKDLASGIMDRIRGDGSRGGYSAV